jgi:serine/threonine protein kinase
MVASMSSDTIGEGTFAKVRITKNIENGDHVAIKILNKAKVRKNKLAEQVKCQDSTFYFHIFSLHN